MYADYHLYTFFSSSLPPFRFNLTIPVLLKCLILFDDGPCSRTWYAPRKYNQQKIVGVLLRNIVLKKKRTKK